MIGRITRIWAKPLASWTLVDLVRAILALSLVSIACGFVLSIVAVIPAVVARGNLRKTLETDAEFEHGCSAQGLPISIGRNSRRKRGTEATLRGASRKCSRYSLAERSARAPHRKNGIEVIWAATAKAMSPKRECSYNIPMMMLPASQPAP
jgi:hypothetical protein